MSYGGFLWIVPTTGPGPAGPGPAGPAPPFVPRCPPSLRCEMRESRCCGVPHVPHAAVPGPGERFWDIPSGDDGYITWLVVEPYPSEKYESQLG